MTGISILHFKQDEEGTIFAHDTALKEDSSEFIETGTQWSIIIPRNSHKIEILSKDEYHAPEPTNFSELGINKSFVIVKKNEKKLIANNYKEEESKGVVNNLQFELKI